MGVVVLGFALRLRGIHDPLLDHPGWRQGDTAAIARNFATLDLNPFHPQADYDGPPPNYVELELQIVPFLAALLYKLFGIHEIFGRLISIGFSLGTVCLLAEFARRIFVSEAAGILAAFLFAVYPGSVYYGRTFMPDTAMVFFLTAALYAAVRWLDEVESDSWARFWAAALLCAAAILAKPVAAVGLVPIAALMFARRGLVKTLLHPQYYAYFAIALLPYAGYDAYLRSIAEWHWASGIVAKHVLPSLSDSVSSVANFRHKLAAFRDALALLWSTMLGPFACALFAIAIAVPVRPAARPLVFAWLGALLAYAYVVVTVERVDYYLYPVLPLAALWSAGSLDRALSFVPAWRERRMAALPALLALCSLAIFFTPSPVRAYYRYNKDVFRAARALDAGLKPGTLVVMGHYDPSVLYYIDRKGWEEDPYLWTPFDEQSAIRKGARYFIAIERRRLERNVELYAWLQRFPVIDPDAKWPVYQTDYAKMLPGAEARWRAFRRREKARQQNNGAAPAEGRTPR
jgi:hypothetical protein